MDVGPTEESRMFFDNIRDLSDLPIIVRGPLSNTELVIKYLEAGSSDFIGKTTPPAVVAAKVQAALREDPEESRPAVISVGEITIDLNRRAVFRDLDEIALTPLEFRLLTVLAENVGKPCPHEMLLQRVWGPDFVDCSHYLRLYIGYLRQKLELDPRKPKLLLNEWGYGYRLAEPKGREHRTVAVRSLRLAQS
jgi:two-component system KDP operon response regulator KdpE